jgi:hypothetical protein
MPAVITVVTVPNDEIIWKIKCSRNLHLTTRSKAWVFGGSFPGIVGSNHAGGGHGCLCRVNVVCCQVEVSATG